MLQKKCCVQGFEFSDSFIKDYTCLSLYISVYLPKLIFPLLKFRDKGERVLAELFLRSKILWYAQNFHWVQNSLKSEEREYLTHHVKFEMCPALSNFFISCSTVKFELGHNFSQFINRFQIGTLESQSQTVFPGFSKFTKKSKIGIFECCYSWTSQFFLSYGRDSKLGFFNISLVLPNISQFTMEDWDF